MQVTKKRQKKRQSPKVLPFFISKKRYQIALTLLGIACLRIFPALDWNSSFSGFRTKVRAILPLFIGQRCFQLVGLSDLELQ
jgi:hypothetical protein